MVQAYGEGGYGLEEYGALPSETGGTNGDTTMTIVKITNTTDSDIGFFIETDTAEDPRGVIAPGGFSDWEFADGVTVLEIATSAEVLVEVDGSALTLDDGLWFLVDAGRTPLGDSSGGTGGDTGGSTGGDTGGDTGGSTGGDTGGSTTLTEEQVQALIDATVQEAVDAHEAGMPHLTEEQVRDVANAVVDAHEADMPHGDGTAFDPSDLVGYTLKFGGGKYLTITAEITEVTPPDGN